MEDYVDIHNRKENYEKALKKLEANTSLNSKNKQLINQFLTDCALGKTLLGRTKKKISEGRLSRYLDFLISFDREFKKPFNEVTQKDMEDYIRNLETNVIKKNKKLNYKNGVNYGDTTKNTMKVCIRKFWKWLNGGKEYPELVQFIDMSLKQKEIPAITKEENDKMINLASTIILKTLLAILFDAGLRIEEALNVRYPDVTKEGEYYKIRIRYSKTKPRTIYVPIYTEIIDLYMKENKEHVNTSNLFFNTSYGAVRMSIKRIGKKALNKDITPHILRHSSATYYATRLNNYQMCNRYGWSMSSDMPSRYIDRQGITDEVVINKHKEEQDLGLRNKYEELEKRYCLVKERLDSMEKSLTYVVPAVKKLIQGVEQKKAKKD